MTLYRKVFTKDRLPQTHFESYLTDKGLKFEIDMSDDKIEWWLEEVDLPTEDDINNCNHHQSYLDSFRNGANYILNKLKG